MTSSNELPLNFKVVNIKDDPQTLDEVDGESQNSGESGIPVGSSTPNIVMKEQNSSSSNRAPSRQGFIEVNASSDGVNNFTLKSGASVSKCPSLMANMSPVVQTVSEKITPQPADATVLQPSVNVAKSGTNSQSNSIDLSNTAPIIKNLENMLKAGNQVFHIQVKVPDAGKDGQNKQIQQVIVVNPGEDADKAMSQAVGEITKRLNTEAAAKLAHGISPEKETIIEITRIANPSESFFSRDNASKEQVSCDPKNQDCDSKVVDVKAVLSVPQRARAPHRRKSPPLGSRYIRTVSPQPVLHPRAVKPPPIINSEELYKNRFRSASVPRLSNPVTTTHSAHKSPATDMTAAMKLGMSNGIHLHNRTTMIPSKNPRNLTMVFSGSSHSNNPVTTIVHPPSAPPKRTIAILNRSRNNSHTYIQPALSSHSNSKTHTVTLSDTFSSVDSADTNTQDLDDAASEDGSLMNDSLTNIQWLGNMKGDNLQTVSHKDIRLVASEKQIEQVNQECGKHKRPPYSYMHLIQMAICSTSDRKMTLKDIYTWIELKFPYYRFNLNKGWRNSIRHNLSLYDIFVREKLPIEGKSATSLWTLHSDFKTRQFATTADDTSNTTIDDFNDSLFACESPTSDSPVFFVSSTPSSDTSRSIATPTPPLLDKKPLPKKKPVPLLPKPPVSQPQTYALIPIQGGVPIVPQQPILVPANWSANSRYPTLDLNNAKRLKRSASPLSSTCVPKRKQIRIAPKLSTHSYYQPWANNAFHQYQKVPTNANSNLNNVSACQSHLDTSDLHHPILDVKFTDTSLGHLDSSDLHHQMLDARFTDSGLGHSLSGDLSAQDLSVHELVNTSRQKPNKRKGAFPKPHLYVERSCVSGTNLDDSNGNIVMLNDSNLSESGINDILASIEKDLCSPAKQLLKTPTKSNNGNLFTSTPLKHGLDSPSWISPIKGFANSDSGLASCHPGTFSPSDIANEKKTSTPLECDSEPYGKQPRTPDVKIDDISALYRPIPGPRVPCKLSDKELPNMGSLSSFEVIGLTPMKSPRLRHHAEPSPTSEANQSFPNLLGDLHLDSLIDCDGINLANISFSHIKCDF